MQRLMNFMLAPVSLILISGVIVLLLSGLLVGEMKQSQPGTVYLKSDVVAGDVREGMVSKKERYVTVTGAHGSQSFTWDQIRYIQDKSPSPSREVDRIVDMIDLLSKLGIAATVLFFTIGLIQYRQGQKWEREKFLAAAVKEFDDAKTIRNARLMLDSLALYEDGRMIDLFPNDQNAANQKVFVSNDEIYKSLTTKPHEDLERKDQRAVAIRDCFDGFFSHLVTFDHYIEQDLITTDALAAHIGYWINLLGPEGSLEPRYKRRILDYATAYEMIGVQSLIDKYNKPTLWERFLGLFIR